MGVDIAVIVLLVFIVFGSVRETKFNNKIYDCHDKICKIKNENDKNS